MNSVSQIDEPQPFDVGLPAVTSDDVSLVRSFLPPELLAELDADLNSLQEGERPPYEKAREGNSDSVPDSGTAFVPPSVDTISLLHRLLSEPLVCPPSSSAVCSLAAGTEMAASSASPTPTAASVTITSASASQSQAMATSSEAEAEAHVRRTSTSAVDYVRGLLIPFTLYP